ncbi:sugar phosphate isomerase/epimerase family protein [Ureibacillus composti]
MKLGLSTYAFFWHMASVNTNRLSVEQVLEETKKYGINLLQICDVEELEIATDAELEGIAKKAEQLGIELEVGTRGIHPIKLERFLKICEKLNSKTLRTMLNSADFAPSFEEAVQILKQFKPAIEEKGVTFAIETYEQRKTEEIVNIVKEVASPNIGVCLDPANCIANLETPEQVIGLAAPYVKNLHLKDFTFVRKTGWVGFSLIGTPFGEGKLDATYMLDELQQHQVNVNAILEFWLPFTNSIEETVKLEKQWIVKSISYIEENLF